MKLGRCVVGTEVQGELLCSKMRELWRGVAAAMFPSQITST